MSDALEWMIMMWAAVALITMVIGGCMHEDAYDDEERRVAALVILLSPLAIVIIPLVMAAFPFFLMWTAVKTLWPSVTKS